MDWFGMEGTLKLILPWAEAPSTTPGCSSLALDHSREGAVTASLGNPCQGLIAPTGKNFLR